MNKMNSFSSEGNKLFVTKVPIGPQMHLFLLRANSAEDALMKLRFHCQDKLSIQLSPSTLPNIREYNEAEFEDIVSYKLT